MKAAEGSVDISLLVYSQDPSPYRGTYYAVVNQDYLPYFASSPGLMAITFPSITATAPRVAAATKSLCT